jgi:hypothetical protein
MAKSKIANSVVTAAARVFSIGMQANVTIVFVRKQTIGESHAS